MFLQLKSHAINYTVIVRTAKCVVFKVKLMFIGHSGSNHGAFYLNRATGVGLSRDSLLCTRTSM